MLPGAEKPNRELRWALAEMVHDSQIIPANPTIYLQGFIKDHRRWHDKWLYTGDLETDFLRFLGETLRLAKASLIGIEVEFKK